VPLAQERPPVTTLPTYKLSRSLHTVHDLWKEWTEGLCGGPAVKDLEERWGTEWRKEDTERRFFNNRRVVLNEVKRVAAEQKISEAEAVEVVERRRLSISPTCSLDRLRKVLRGEK